LTKLPVISGKQLCKILSKTGYLIDHQTGSHIILRNENPPAGFTLEEFNKIMK
jgi:predicted RNA binding protein YcfA (HicA-like mRNA interferase family)